jgi:flagellar hook-associated protein 3 FlgL
MRLTGFPDLLGFGLRNRAVSGLKARLDVVSREAVTGLQADVTKATNGRTGEAHLITKALEDIQQSGRMGALAKTRLDMTSQAISGGRSAMNGLSTRAVVALEGGGATGIKIISDEAEANLRSAMTAFGAQQGNRNLLSGAATNQSTFAGADVLLDDIRNIMQTAGNADQIEAAIETYFESPTGGFQTRIYQGSDIDAPPVNIGNGQTLDMSVRGDNKAIRDSLRGMAVIATAKDAPLGDSQFRQVFLAGASQAANGETGLIDTEGKLGIISETLAKTQQRNQAEQISLTTAFQSLVGRDQFEAASELKQLEVALESSYIITSRLSDLSLSNYLR